MRALGLLLLVPLAVQAGGEGTWQGSHTGTTLDHRGVAATSQPLTPAQPVNGTITLVAWRYVIDGPTPGGLTVTLCAQSRCATIDGQSGTTRAFTGIDANTPLRFIWALPGAGAIYPPLRVRSNQVIVNYH